MSDGPLPDYSQINTTAKAADSGPLDIREPIETIKSFWFAFKGGKYREGIAGVIVLLMFLWRRFFWKWITRPDFLWPMKPWAVGLITVGFGYLGSIPAALAGPDWNWWAFMIEGLLTSSEAMLFWQTLGKHALPKVFGPIKKEP
jgi:hypothetical protein